MSSASPAIDLEVVAEPLSPRQVRGVFARRFSGWARLDDLLLCLSEVVTNAVLHAGAPIRVVATTVNAAIRVEVSDGSIVPPVVRAVEELAPTGRGLHLLDRLTSGWGFDISTDGKTVWFEMAEVAG